MDPSFSGVSIDIQKNNPSYLVLKDITDPLKRMRLEKCCPRWESVEVIKDSHLDLISYDPLRPFRWKILCLHCGLKTDFKCSLEDAVKEWNELVRSEKAMEAL